MNSYRFNAFSELKTILGPHASVCETLVEEIIHSAMCHSGLRGWITDKLQFNGLWRRELS
jgi:hypothetical protein